MRAAKTVIMIWIFCELMLWIRDGRGFCILEALPFVERQDTLSPDYDWFALAALSIGLWGYLMLISKPRRKQQPSSTRFRTSILLVPATIIALALISQRITPSLRFAEVVASSNKPLDHAYLAVLSVLVFAVLLAIRRFRDP